MVVNIRSMFVGFYLKSQDECIRSACHVAPRACLGTFGDVSGGATMTLRCDGPVLHPGDNTSSTLHLHFHDSAEISPHHHLCLVVARVVSYKLLLVSQSLTLSLLLSNLLIVQLSVNINTNN